MFAIKYCCRLEINIRAIIVPLMIGTDTRLSKSNRCCSFRIFYKPRDKSLLLIGCHRLAKQMGQFPTLVHNYSKSEIPDGKFFSHYAKCNYICFGSAKFFLYTKSSESHRIGFLNPVPRNSFFSSRQSVSSKYIWPNMMLDKLPS